MKINNFRGDLTDISAKKESMVGRHVQAGFAIFHVELVLARRLTGLHHKAISALDIHAIVPLLI
jgi:hypothetical protein